MLLYGFSILVAKYANSEKSEEEEKEEEKKEENNNDMKNSVK